MSPALAGGFFSIEPKETSHLGLFEPPLLGQLATTYKVLTVLLEVLHGKDL